MSSSQRLTKPIDVDTCSWQKVLDSAAQERERLVASLRQELSLLEKLTSQAVSSLSACPQSLADSASPRSPVKEWTESPAYRGSTSPGQSQFQLRMSQPGSTQWPAMCSRSASTPCLASAQGGQNTSAWPSSCKAYACPAGSACSGFSPAELAPTVQKPKQQEVTHTVARGSVRGLPVWPRSNPFSRKGPVEPVQTPPRPRPLVHL